MRSKKGFCDLGFAKVDIEREQRRGFAEAIYCPGKDIVQLKKIAQKLSIHKQNLILTKLEKSTFLFLKKHFPRLKYNSTAKLGYLLLKKCPRKKGAVAVISAGTSDLPVAEEAALTLEVMGNQVIRLFDVGVAGVHRFLSNIDTVRKAQVIVVVAGMEGALASLVSGLVKVPVVAVPTSCGYGAHFAGLSPLLTMLNSCSPGIGVVNIDNGFGAGYLAALINR